MTLLESQKMKKKEYFKKKARHPFKFIIAYVSIFVIILL